METIRDSDTKLLVNSYRTFAQIKWYRCYVTVKNSL